MTIRETEFLYGIECMNGKPIRFDRKHSNNTHGIIFGKDSMDRTYFMQREILKVLANTEDRIYVIALNDAYSELAKLYHGAVLEYTINTEQDLTVPDSRLVVFRINTSPLYLAEVYGSVIQTVIKQIQKNLSDF